MSTGFWGGADLKSPYIGGTTIFGDYSEEVIPEYAELTEITTHSLTCKTCRSKSNQQKCASCDGVRSDIQSAKNYCFGCKHTICERHRKWPCREHSPEEHGPSTAKRGRPRKKH